MQAHKNDETAKQRAYDATLENCETVADWARATKRAGGGIYGPPHMMVNISCADYRERNGGRLPQPICSEAVAKTGGVDFGEEPTGESASEAEALLRSLIKKDRTDRGKD